MNLHFFITGDINTPSGEFIYNKKIVDGMRNRKYKVFVHNLPADFPFPNANSISQFETVVKSIPSDDLLFIPGAVIASSPSIFEEYLKSHKIIAFVHVPASLSNDLTIYQKEIALASEKTALAKIKICITSNEYAKDALEERGVPSSAICLAKAGTDPYPVKTNYRNLPLDLLSISNYTRKNGLINLIKALSALKNKNWKLICYGVKDYDPNYFDEINQLIKKYGLAERIALNDTIEHDNISEVYLASDLVVLPSDNESFGMTISEALMHGIPVFSSATGLINRDIPTKACKFFKPGNVYDIQSVLELLLENELVYKELCTNAKLYHHQARLWEKTIDDFDSVLKKVNLLFN